MELDARLAIAFQDQCVRTANDGDRHGGRVVRCHEVVDQRVDATAGRSSRWSLGCERVAREDKANECSVDNAGDHDV